MTYAALHVYVSESYIPVPQDATSFTHRVFTDVIKLKMRALGWILIHSDLCPYKKGPRGHRHGEDSVKTHRDTTTLASQGGGPGTEPSSQPSEGPHPANALILGFQPPELGSFVTAATGN